MTDDLKFVLRPFVGIVDERFGDGATLGDILGTRAPLPTAFFALTVGDLRKLAHLAEGVTSCHTPKDSEMP